MCQCCAEKKDIYLPQLATVADISQMNVTEKYLRLSMVCEIFFWRAAISLFTVTYEPFEKGD